MNQIARFLSSKLIGKDLYGGLSHNRVPDLTTKEGKATEEGNSDKMEIVKTMHRQNCLSPLWPDLR